MDYVFFVDSLRQEFVDHAARLGAQCSLSSEATADDEVAALLASVDDDLPDDTLDALEDYYDELMERQSVSLAATQGWVDMRVAGVTVTLDDGTQRTVRLEPALANRLLENFSAEEIHDLVTAVARSLAAPEEPRLCKPV